jgi:hypothetical protein
LLGCILGAYLFNVERWNPSAFFGIYHDDSIYFSAAKSLAQGQGLTLASFPGNPPQSYPILYPWMLSRIWKLDASFPHNVRLGVDLTEFFGCCTLIAVFLVLRRLEGLHEWIALLLLALLAFQPYFLRLSGLLLSDVPFVALLWASWALVIIGVRSRSVSAWMLVAGALSGLSVGIRVVGVALIAGVICALLVARAFRNAVAFAVPACIVTTVVSWPTIFHARSAALAASPAEPGWNQLLLAYTEYGRFQWGLGIPSLGAFVTMLKLNLLALLTYPGAIVAGPSGVWGDRIMAVLSVPIWLGILRQRRKPEWRPIIYGLAFYSGILLVWPYSIPDRFLLPFIPLFLAGLWCECLRLRDVILKNYRFGVSAAQKTLAVCLAAVLILLGGTLLRNYFLADPAALRAASEQQTGILPEKQQAYQWILEHTRAGERLVAWEDATWYLYTGRQALRPMAVLPQPAYVAGGHSFEFDLDHICDAPRHVGARYWVTTRNDFALERETEALRARVAQIKAVLPLLFNSENSYVQIYDTSCISHTEQPECLAAAPVLFPTSTPTRE